ncbi:MAG: adenosylcobinamide-GDP ribazoletransferase [Butyrivibrio sp.]|nr:adenosylcobinamide-GDP ribazoletransferase [Butyrivibrio sp.]
MSIIRSIIVSFSLYSRIPMPVFTWNEDDTKHAIAFLPLVGIVIGALSYAVIRITEALDIPLLCRVLLLTLTPVLITGGFHLDGFMDVQDAGNSYQDREKKLEIMKDPHVGAFAIISLSVLGLIWVCFLYLTMDSCMQAGTSLFMNLYCGMFFYVRALCGIGSICFSKAKKDGMLNMETKKSSRADIIFLIVQALLGAAFMVYTDLFAGSLAALILLVYLFIYKAKTGRLFGGVTGDTAGYFVVMGECIFLIILGVCRVIQI